jgi:hypothetical protein
VHVGSIIEHMTDINLDDDQRIEEIRKLVKDNNRMLHSMRRNAFIVGFFKFLMYAAIIGGSYWVYVTYAAPLLTSLLTQLKNLNDTGAQVQQQIGSLQQGSSVGVNSFLDQIQKQLKNLPGVGQ